ncbi:MAG: phosphoglycerate dehydrogenase [Pseudomonadota bacterium]
MRVAVGSRSFSRHPVLREELKAAFPQTTFNDAGAKLSGDALISFLQGHDAAIIALESVSDHILSALPDLRVISKFGVGYDGLDLDAMRRRGVLLGWTGGSNRRAVSELALTLMLSLLRRLPSMAADLRDGVWRVTVGRQLTGRTVGIIGCGRVGQDVVRILAPFGCRILVNDIRDRSAFCAETGAESVRLETLLAEAEVVSLHTPLDAGTRDLLSADRLSLMRSDAVLINVARGGLVDEAALATMLDEDRLAGAGFDVFSEEPPTNAALLGSPKMMVTPHIGGSTEEGVLAMGRAAIAGLSDARPPEAGVHPS